MLLKDKQVNLKALELLTRWHEMATSNAVTEVAVEMTQILAFAKWLKDSNLLDLIPNTADEKAAWKIVELYARWRLLRRDFASWALLMFGQDKFSPLPMTVRIVWDALEKNRLINVMGATSTGKTFTAIIYFLAQYCLDPEWTRIDVIGPQKAHAKKNAFATFKQLHSGAIIPLPGKQEAEYIGLDRSKGHGIFIQTISGTGADFRGTQLYDRPPHPCVEIGTLSNHHILIDEIQQVHDSLYPQIANLLGKVDVLDNVHRKIYGSANPTLIDSPYGKQCIPVGGWAFIDDDTDEWESSAEWHCCRLNVTKTENYQVIDKIHPVCDLLADKIARLGLGDHKGDTSKGIKPFPVDLNLDRFKKSHGVNAQDFLNRYRHRMPPDIVDKLTLIVSERKKLVRGLQGWDNAQQTISRNLGDITAPEVYTFVYGKFPPAGAYGSVIKQNWMDDSMGEWIFSELTIPFAGVDLGFTHDKAIAAFGKAGRATGYRYLDKKTKQIVTKDFGFTPETKSANGSILHAPQRITAYAVQVESLYTFPQTENSTKLGELIKAECIDRGIAPENVAVDATGIGKGTADWLSSYWSPDVIHVNYSDAASSIPITAEDKHLPLDLYASTMTELWYALARWMEINIVKFSMTVEQETFSELTGRMADTRNGGGKKMRVEGKDSYKARGNPSPDRADAVTIFNHAVRKGVKWIPSFKLHESKPKEEAPESPEHAALHGDGDDLRITFEVPQLCNSQDFEFSR